MKLLSNIKANDYAYNNMQNDLRKEHNLKLCLIKDLRIGLKYIYIPTGFLLSEIKKYNFKELSLRNMLQSENTTTYNQYKSSIKRMVKNKEIFIKEL